MIDVDHFNVEGIKNKIQCELNGTVPDVIVGISMGGLIAPHLAKDYPTTKLIMIASGPKLKTKIPERTSIKMYIPIHLPRVFSGSPSNIFSLSIL